MMATTSHNVANANTPGFSRQRSLLGVRGAQDIGPGFVGAGVQINRIERIADQFVTSRLRDSANELGRLGQLSALAARVDRVVSDRASGVALPLSSFLDANFFLKFRVINPHTFKSYGAGAVSPFFKN